MIECRFWTHRDISRCRTNVVAIGAKRTYSYRITPVLGVHGLAAIAVLAVLSVLADMLDGDDMLVLGGIEHDYALG